jgi:hypothetical protein
VSASGRIAVAVRISGNVAIGDSAGAGVEGDFNIYIGFFAGPTPSPAPVPESETIRIGDVFNVACYMGGISGVPVSGDPVVVDGNGQLGVAPVGSPLSANELLKQQQVVHELKAELLKQQHLVHELNATTERQAAVIALQEWQIAAVTASIKQQAEQIQKVSAQLEVNKPAPQTVLNNQY